MPRSQGLNFRPALYLQFFVNRTKEIHLWTISFVCCILVMKQMTAFLDTSYIIKRGAIRKLLAVKFCVKKNIFNFRAYRYVFGYLNKS